MLNSFYDTSFELIISSKFSQDYKILIDPELTLKEILETDLWIPRPPGTINGFDTYDITNGPREKYKIKNEIGNMRKVLFTETHTIKKGAKI